MMMLSLKLCLSALLRKPSPRGEGGPKGRMRGRISDCVRCTQEVSPPAGGGCNSCSAPGLAEQTPRCVFWRSPRGSPTQTRKVSLKSVGEGLKVNRPKAERSHPGVCPPAGRPVSGPYEKEGTASKSTVGAARPSLPPSRGKVARPKVVTDEGDFLACTPPGGSPKGSPTHVWKAS